MKLLSVRLNNVRRFTQPVEVAGIGPGLNVLTAPNEQGKSTLFDALHALFFFEARSWKQKDAATLAPHAGGNPEISAEIEVEGQIFRLSKVFSSKASARTVTIERGAHLFKQGEEAEAWIRNLIKPPKDGGPAGLLWVRQGLTSFQSGKEDDTLTARRDLLSSVAGEIEEVTGGRQMEAIRSALKDDLDQYLTATGKPRQNGPLGQAEQAITDLEARQDDLSAQVETLRGLLGERRQLQTEKAELAAPEAKAERQSALSAAQIALEAAKAHQIHLKRAEEKQQNAKLMLEAHQARVTSTEQQIAEFDRAQLEFNAVQGQMQVAEQKLALAKSTWTEAQDRSNATADALRTSEQLRDQVHARDTALKGAARRQELLTRQAEGDQLRRDATTAQSKIDAAPTAAQIEHLEHCWRALDLLIRSREASAAAITWHALPSQEDRVLLDGAPLPRDQRLPLPNGGEISIAGMGTIEVHPAEQNNAQDLRQAQEAFDQALSATGQDTLAEARQADRTRKAAEDELRDAKARLAITLPNGVEALRAEIAALPAEAVTPSGQATADATDLPSLAEAEAAYRAARDAHDHCRADLEGARASHDALNGDMRELRGRRDEAQNRFVRARDTLGDPAQTGRGLADLQARTPDLEQALADAGKERDRLEENAPDLAMAQASAQRARNVVERADQRLAEITPRLSALEALITHTADLAVEEKLVEVAGQLDTARAHAAQIQGEVQILQRLDSTLAEVQKQAHDAYIGPIRNELHPLLRMVLPGAELTLDADSVLPTGLSRPQGEDSYDQLSGGTQEQIALLVRLAFARLLAKAGTPAPIILDDAIVYTDDDRIERMFNALTQQAGELQIIVLSCRQKVFRGLGGQSLEIRQI